LSLRLTWIFPDTIITILHGVRCTAGQRSPGLHVATAAYRRMVCCTIRRISGNPSERSSGAILDDERGDQLDAARSSFVGRMAAHTTTDEKTSP
jgi:hypothetical protein